MTPIPSRPTTPKPPYGSDQFRSGMLTIRIFSGESALAESYTANTDKKQGGGYLLHPERKSLMSSREPSRPPLHPGDRRATVRVCSANDIGGFHMSSSNSIRTKSLSMPWEETSLALCGTIGQTCAYLNRPITSPVCAYCCNSPAMYHVLPTYLSRPT